MTRSEMLQELRSIIDDTTARPKWSDRLLLGWMAEGQDKFCEETGYFVDATTHTIATVAGQAIYTMPDRLIAILDIFNGTQKLGRYQEYLKSWGVPHTNSSVFNPDSTVPYVWQADQEAEIITLLPTPQEVITLNLRVWRYPNFALDDNDTGAGENAEPEIPVRFQRGCIEWAAHKAYSDHDSEKGDPVKSKDHFAAWRMYVSDGKKARRRIMAQEYYVGANPAYVVR